MTALRFFILFIYLNVSYSITYLIQVDILEESSPDTILQLSFDHIRNGIVIDSSQFSITSYKNKIVAQTIFRNFHEKDKIRITYYSLRTLRYHIKKYIKSSPNNINLVILDNWLSKISKESVFSIYLKNMCLKYSNNQIIFPDNPYYPKNTHNNNYRDNISAKCNFRLNSIANRLELKKEDIQFNKNFA